VEYTYWLIDRLLAGRVGPVERPWQVERLHEAGIEVIVSLNREADRAAITSAGMRHYQLPQIPSLPLFGPLLFRLELARLTRTLGALMKSGLPVITAMEITQRVVQNSLIAKAMSDIKDSVQKGDNIADAVRTTGLFPPVVYHLIATGQMSGNIEDGLIEIAEMYDNEVQTAVRTLTSLLEPIILLVMGAVVGFIVMAILLPVFEINQAL